MRFGDTVVQIAWCQNLRSFPEKSEASYVKGRLDGRLSHHVAAAKIELLAPKMAAKVWV
jgi:hypothetical protein